MSNIDLVLDETEETAPALDLGGDDGSRQRQIGTPLTMTHLAQQGTQGGSGLSAVTHDLAATVH